MVAALYKLLCCFQRSWSVVISIGRKNVLKTLMKGLHKNQFSLRVDQKIEMTERTETFVTLLLRLNIDMLIGLYVYAGYERIDDLSRFFHTTQQSELMEGLRRVKATPFLTYLLCSATTNIVHVARGEIYNND